MLSLLFLFRQRSETQQRIKIVKNLGGFARKRSACGGNGREFSADDPRQYLFPILRRGGPAALSRPFALFHGVPVAFVTPAKALLLFCDPAGISVYARLGDQCECELFAFPAGVDAESRGDGLHG